MAKKLTDVDDKHDANRDPITGEPGAHPVGVGAGGSGGAMAGAAVGGAIGGPVGALVGGAVGAVAGGYAGKAAGEAVNPTEEDAYWRKNYATRPYVNKGADYSDYERSYRYGWEAASRPEFTGKSFEDVEPNLERDWSTYRGPAQTEWRDARSASRDAFDRIRSRAHGAAAGTGTVARDTADYASDKGDAVWDQVKGNWNQFRGSVKEKWNDLTDDDLDAMDGRREKIVGKIQERYGEAKWNEADIAREFRGFGRR
jgi:uncharacterized protein YjbJ (UPF0337 family)